MTSRWLAAISICVLFLVPFSAPRAQGYGGGEEIECQSHNYAYTRCNVPWRDAHLIRQLSDTRCIRGQNWGIDRGGIWVDRGCGGTFVATRGGNYERGGYDRDNREYGGGWRPGPDWDHRFALGCESIDGRSSFCQVDVGGGGRVYLERQLSSTPCIEGQTWGWNRAGVWVNNGCRATFTVDRRWR